MKAYPVIESMTKVQVGMLTVRVWRDEQEVLDEYQNEDIFKLVRLVYYGTGYPIPLKGVTKTEVAEEVAKLPRVNAVEVTHTVSGQGLIIYTQ